MALKAILDTIDDLPEDIQSEYTKKKVGDKEVYVLEVEGIQAHPDAAALKVALDRQKAENKTLKTEKTALESKLKDFPEEFTVDEWMRLQALDIDESDPEGKVKKKAKEDERLATAKASFQQQIDTLKIQVKDWETKYNADIGKERTDRASDKAKRELQDALIAVGVKPELMDGANAVLAQHVKHEIEEDGTIRTFVNTDLGETDVKSFVDNWAKGDKGKAYIAPPTGGGSESKKINNQQTGDNPFHATFWNKSKQGALLKSDRNKAERFAKLGGFATLDDALKATAPLKPATT